MFMRTAAWPAAAQRRRPVSGRNDITNRKADHMYDLRLAMEQIEIRDTVRDFVEREIKPAATHPKRLEPFEKPLLKDLLDQAARLGLRTLTLSESAGGAGADTLTSCIVLEELAAGDVDIAVALAHTAALGRALERAMSAAQRDRFLAAFMQDDQYHLALAGATPDAGVGWSYCRPSTAVDSHLPAAAAKDGGWVIDGTLPFVSNAPLAKLLVVNARTDPGGTGMNGIRSFLVPHDAAGLEIGAPYGAFDNAGQRTRWHHGSGAAVTFKECRVAADALLGGERPSPFVDGSHAARLEIMMAAANLGLGRAAYDAAVDYARIRRQGGRNIIEHQAIGAKVADMAIRLELARSLVWKAAWTADHPEAAAETGASQVPLHVMARVYTAEAMHEVTVLAAECFGAMGVMRDMPLQKYVHDGFIFAHSDASDGAAKLAVAEAVAGYQRPLAA
jgi:alkylation response protein AidB-like acyl-CoA dehydrogenase